MSNQEAIRLIRNLPTMCEFTDAYGEPIDSDAYYEAVDIAISALHAQDAPDINVGDMKTQLSAEGTTNLQQTCNRCRQAAIDAIDDYLDEYSGLDEEGYHSEKWCAMAEAKMVIENLPSVQPEIIRCKDCKHSRFFDPCFYCYEFGEEIIVPENGFCFMADRRADE